MRLRHSLVFVGATSLILTGWSVAQPPPARVAYTEAREHSVRPTVELPGTVEARTSSLVASEVDGLVQSLAGTTSAASG